MEDEQTIEHFNQMENCIDQAVVSETIDGFDTNTALTEILAEATGIDEEKSKGIVAIISNTIDEIDKNYQDLQNHKAQGGSTKEWLSNVIEKAGEQHDKTEIVQHILTGVEAVNQDIADELHRNGSMEEPLQCTSEEDLGEYTGLNKRRYAEEITNAVSCNTLLASITFQKGKLKIPKECRENPLLKKYFETPLNAPGDSPTKKAVSIGLAIAREKQLLPKEMQQFSDEEIAYTVDRGLTAAKTAYKVGTGELSVIKAINHCIDRTVSAVGYAVKTAFTALGTVVGKITGQVVSNAINSRLPKIIGKPIAKGADWVCRAAGSKAGKSVGKYIASGIKKLGNAAKTMVKTIVTGAKKVCNGVKNVVKGLFS